MGKYDKQKNQVITCVRWLSEHGYFGALMGSGGNVSTIIKKDHLVLITPFDQPYHNMTADDLRAMDSDLIQVKGAELPSIEISMHIRVYRQRPDVTAVIHTHSVYASVFSVLNKPIPSLFDEITYAIGPVVEIVPYALAASPALIDNVTSRLHNKCYCYILQNHGALCLGKTIEQALKNAELLEKVAKIYYHALATGQEITRLPESSVQQLIEMRNLR